MESILDNAIVHGTARTSRLLAYPVDHLLFREVSRMCTELTGCIRSVGCKATSDLSALVFLLDCRSRNKTIHPSI